MGTRNGQSCNLRARMNSRYGSPPIILSMNHLPFLLFPSNCLAESALLLHFFLIRRLVCNSLSSSNSFIISNSIFLSLPLPPSPALLFTYRMRLKDATVFFLSHHKCLVSVFSSIISKLRLDFSCSRPSRRVHVE